MTVLEWWGLWRVEGLGCVLDFLAVFTMQCSGSYWRKTGFGMWNSGMTDVCQRSGKGGMGRNYASWMCNSMNGDGASIYQGVAWTAAVAWMRSAVYAFWNCCSCCGGNGSGIVIGWNVSYVCDHSWWSVICPLGCGHIEALNEGLSWWCGVPDKGILLGQSVQSDKIHCNCNTVHRGSDSQTNLFVHKQSIYHH